MGPTMKTKLVLSLLDEVRDRHAQALDEPAMASALELARAVSEITAWRDDDRRLGQLETLLATSGCDAFSPCAESRWLIGQYGIAGWSSPDRLVQAVFDAERRAATQTDPTERRAEAA